MRISTIFTRATPVLGATALTLAVATAAAAATGVPAGSKHCFDASDFYYYGGEAPKLELSASSSVDWEVVASSSPSQPTDNVVISGTSASENRSFVATLPGYYLVCVTNTGSTTVQVDTAAVLCLKACTV